MTYQIAKAADGTIRGPWTDTKPLLPGETMMTLTAAQYAALGAVRKANPGVTKFTWDGNIFAVAPIESLRLGLLALYNGMPGYAQDKFKNDFEAVYSRLKAGDVAGALTIITLIPTTGLPQHLIDAHTAMLALFTQYFPTVVAAS